MANRHRGEIAARLDGRERTLCLTLGALAELEASFGADDLVALAARFESGRLSARDIVRIIGCGLRGAGEAVSDDEVAAMRTEGGAAGFATIAVELIRATFGGDAGGEEREGENPPRQRRAAPLGRADGVRAGRAQAFAGGVLGDDAKEMAAAMRGGVAGGGYGVRAGNDARADAALSGQVAGPIRMKTQGGATVLGDDERRRVRWRMICRRARLLRKPSR